MRRHSGLAMMSLVVSAGVLASTAHGQFFELFCNLKYGGSDQSCWSDSGPSPIAGASGSCQQTGAGLLFGRTAGSGSSGRLPSFSLSGRWRPAGAGINYQPYMRTRFEVPVTFSAPPGNNEVSVELSLRMFAARSFTTTCDDCQPGDVIEPPDVLGMSAFSRLEANPTIEASVGAQGPVPEGWTQAPPASGIVNIEVPRTWTVQADARLDLSVFGAIPQTSFGTADALLLLGQATGDGSIGPVFTFSYLDGTPCDDCTADAPSIGLVDNFLVPPGCPGDVTGDGVTDVFDFNEVVGAFGQQVVPGRDGDLTFDGVVNVFDFNRVVGDFGCGT